MEAEKDESGNSTECGPTTPCLYTHECEAATVESMGVCCPKLGKPQKHNIRISPGISILLLHDDLN